MSDISFQAPEVPVTLPSKLSPFSQAPEAQALSGSMFERALSAPQRQTLDDLLIAARQAPPPDYLAFFCGDEQLGYLPKTHAIWLASALQNCRLEPERTVWDASSLMAEQRSASLQAALVDLREQGHVAAWRNEAFSFSISASVLHATEAAEFLRIERAGFRFLGLMSHAVHINSFTPDGKMWCGLRSTAKATDPGLWDNFTAGGLAASESLAECAARELWEEAGFKLDQVSLLEDAGHVRISRPTASGWHDEVLHVYNLPLPNDFCPANQDGEVQAFACLSAPEVMARMDAHQFTHDAALAIAQGLRALHTSNF
jgi:8-oxo-dGTP pyrophosphatase MutT (NUDIX family)